MDGATGEILGMLHVPSEEADKGVEGTEAGKGGILTFVAQVHAWLGLMPLPTAFRTAMAD